MEITNSVALVTGANRGLGKAYSDALLAAGAKKVYAGARDPSQIGDNRVVPVKLDVTKQTEIIAAANQCSDITILINNAGVLFDSPSIAPTALHTLRQEMEVNVFGLLAMSGAFAPILRKKSHSVIVNVLSVVSWFSTPIRATYCASKFAALALTDAMRIELKAQRTRVIAVHAGYIDTDMVANIEGVTKVSPRQVAERTLDGIRHGKERIFADARAESIWNALRHDPDALVKQIEDDWNRFGRH